MTHLLGFLFLAALPAAMATPAHADEGELFVSASLGGELAWLAHPLVHDSVSSPFVPTGSFAVVPRLGAGLSYGLTNALALDVGVDGGAAPNLRAAGVSIGNTTGDLLSGGYFELTTPFSLSWRLDSGSELSARLGVALGPAVTLWSGNAFADPGRLDGGGLPSKLPLEVADVWNVGAMARVSGAVEGRVFDVLVVAVEPYVGMTWAGTFGVHAGVLLSPALALGLGPL